MASAPRIVLDARPLSHPQNGGFRAYVRSLVTGLVERVADGANDLQLILYIDRPLPADVEAWLPPGIEKRILSPSRLQSDFFLFARQVRRDRPDLVHGTVNYLPLGLSAPTTLTVHDAMGIKTYEWSAKVVQTTRQKLMAAYWRVLTNRSARTAKRIVTVSNGAADELAAALALPREHFAVVYNGITLPAPRHAAPRLENVALAIASPDLRKNLDCLYLAVTEAKHHFKNIPLLHIVCTHRGAADRAEAMLKARGVTQFRLLCHLDDAALADAYAQATVFVWPSRMEGFGLPPLEAMRTGCPVVSSNAPVMPEILGDVPRYFGPEKPDELAEQLNALLCDRRERAERSERGRTHARQFTCRRMAEQTVAVWHQAIAGGQR